MFCLKGQLRERMEIECISLVMRRGRLKWCGHVERIGESNYVISVRGVERGERR